MEDKVRLPQYMHLPMQFLWFDTEEMMVIVFFYVFALVFGGYVWIGVIVGPYLYMQVKRKKPRGFLRHLIYSLGFTKLKGYPPPQAFKFYE